MRESYVLDIIQAESRVNVFLAIEEWKELAPNKNATLDRRRLTFCKWWIIHNYNGKVLTKTTQNKKNKHFENVS